MNNITFKKDLLGVQDDLLRFAYKLTSDREEANDLLQETSLKALDNEEKYTPDTNFKGWIYTIMRNIFINNYRKVVRDQTFVDTTDNLYHLNLPRDAAFESTKRLIQIVNSCNQSERRNVTNSFCDIGNRMKRNGKWRVNNRPQFTENRTEKLISFF